MNPNPFISWVWILTVINVTLCNALWTYFCQKCGNPTYFNVYDVCVCARERERPHLRYAATRADVRDHSSGSAPGRWSNVMTLYQCHDIVTTLTLSHASQSHAPSHCHMLPSHSVRGWSVVAHPSWSPAFIAHTLVFTCVLLKAERFWVPTLMSAA